MFDPRTELATHPPCSWGDLSFFPNNRKTVQNHDQSRRSSSWNTCGGGVQFRLATTETDSGICSPPLWSNSSPPRSQNPAQSRQKSLRKEAIAKGQSELMEMVKNMPESCYELSLKDIVERKNRIRLAGEGDQEDFSVKSNEEKAISGKNNKRGMNKINGNIKILRSRSIDQNRGMLLKMGFVPFSFIGSKKKKSCCVTNNKNNTCAKVSPKPEFVDKSSTKNVEREWWKKRMAVSGGSESGGESSHGGSTARSGSGSSSTDSSSSNSSSNSRRNVGGRSNGCLSIFRFKKGKHTTGVKSNPYS